MTKKTETKKSAMLFTAGRDWHLDIFLESNAQIMEMKLKIYSKAFPDYIYSIAVNTIIQNGQQTQIPVDVAKIGLSTDKEQVWLDYEITYYY